MPASNLRRVPDRDGFQPSGPLLEVEGRASEPWFLLGFPTGEVLITHALPDPRAVKLYRFRTAEQAKAAALVLMQNATLSARTEIYRVPEAAAARTPYGSTMALIGWTRRIEPMIVRALARLGPGHYSLADQARRAAA